jgi:hypothetical protein
VEIIKRKPIMITVSICFIILIGSFAATFFKTSLTTTKEMPVNQFKELKVNNADIGDYISKNHEYWNEELCWGRSKNYSFSVFQKNYDAYVKDLNIIINAVGDDELKSDFKHVHSLLENAAETKNIDFLIDVHRIFHDLDVNFNEYASSDYYKVTQYGGEK